MHHRPTPTDRKNLRKTLLRASVMLMAAVLLILCMPAGIEPVHAAKLTDSKVQSYEEELAKKEEEMKKLKQSIATANTEAEKKLAEKNQLDAEVNLLIEKIDLTTEFIAELEASIAEKDGEISDKQAAYERKYALFKERLRVTHEEGQASYLEMLLGAESLADFLSRIDRIGAMLEYDNKIMRELKDEKHSLEAIRTDFSTQKTKNEELLASLKKDKAELDQKVKQAANFIKKYENDAVMYKNMYEKALEEEEKLQEELQKYLEELQKKLNSKYVGGTFMWPGPLDYTRVSSAYGWRINPLTGKNELHNGIDLPAAYGTYIYAANAGKVTISSTHYSYGKYIMIDHGGGYATLYAHCSKLLVSVGAQVKKGQVIAYVGSPGYSAGNHLHFSLYEENKHTDPMKFFSGK